MMPYFWHFGGVMSNTNLTGWFKYHRSRINHWLWQDKPYAYGQAWDYLYAHAVHSETTILHRGTPIHLKTGDLVMSVRRLAEGCGWNKEKAARFISLLEKEKFIEVKKDQRLDIIHIFNFNVFQDTDVDTNKDTNIDPDIDSIKDTHKDGNIDSDIYKNKNIKNVKNNKNEKEKKKTRARRLFPIFCK